MIDDDGSRDGAGKNGDRSPSARQLVFDGSFRGGELDPECWLPYYLPHWTTRERALARYTLGDDGLVLSIEPDQSPWCPEFDGGVKCSSIQTGQWSGPLGSGVGQHRFREGLAVRSKWPERRLYAPLTGFIEMRAKADISANNLVALYLIGFEDIPEDSGEITVMEIFGTGTGPDGTKLGHGIKRINDTRLDQDFHDDRLPFDVADWHVYAADWTSDGVGFYLDGRLIRRCPQSPGYPMQLMLGIYELPDIASAPRDTPATFTVDYVRGYSG